MNACFHASYGMWRDRFMIDIINKYTCIDWNTIYNMPVWLRKFTFNEINKFYQEEKEAYENKSSSTKTTAIDPSGKINTPAFSQVSKNYKSPNSNNFSYVTKASKK